MKVLITGGAGFIGSHLSDLFLASGAAVTVLDNLSTGRTANIRHNLKNPRFTFVRGDIMDAPTVEKLVASHDLICHLAAVVGVRHVLDNPVRSIVDNTVGTQLVLGMAGRCGKRVLFASTSEIYGKNPKLPFSEDDDSLFGSTRVPRWSYALGKAVGEHLCFAYQTEGLQVSVVRYVNAYGPRLDQRGYGSVIAKFISQALSGRHLTVHGDGLQTRCFTYVEDSAMGSFLAATKKEALGEVFNIGSTVRSSILEMAHMVLDLTRSRSDIRFIPYEKVYGSHFEDMTRELDSSKAEKVLGFKAKLSLREGIETTIAWFRKHPGRLKKPQGTVDEE
jgi:UDP-glucose 4-epimerase